MTGLSGPVHIVDVEVTDVVMPKEDPHWRFALGARPAALGVVVRLESQGGVSGYGFASEIPHLGHPIDTLRTTIRQMAAKLVGADGRDRGPLLRGLAADAQGCRPALAAVEMALYDLAARAMEVPVYVLLGGAFRRSFPVLRILALKDPDQVAVNALRLVREGYRYLKIKLDNQEEGLDAARVAAVREAVGPKIHLTLDANQSYSPTAAVELFDRVARYGIDLFEQPVAAGDFDGLRHVTSSVECLVEADESAASAEDVFRLVQERAISSVSLKLLKLGGLDALRVAASICHAAGIQCRMGAHVGSRLLSAAALHVAAATANIDYACELGEFERLLDDPFEGLAVRDGYLTVPDGPGLGVRPAAAVRLR